MPLPTTAPVRYHTGALATDAAASRFDGLLAPTLAHRRRTGPVAEQVVAVVATEARQPVGVALGQVRPGLDVGEVLCLGVVPDARRRGTGRGLLARLETALADAGCPAVQGTFRSDWTGVEAVEALLDGAGWGPPVVQRLYFKVPPGRFMSRDQISQIKPPAGYEIADWSTLSTDDRAHVEALVAADPAAQPLSPFQHPDAVSAAMSVWLRHGGEIVGWHLVLVPTTVAVEYAALYVAPAHRKSGAGLALIAASGTRHFEERDPSIGAPRVPETSLFAVEPQSGEMRAIAEAHFDRPGITKTTVWLRGKRLA